MERHIYWKPWKEPGLEHLRFVQTEHGILADGLILRLQNNSPFRAHYQIQCDTHWRVRKVTIRLLDHSNRALTLETDGAGHWTDANGRPVSSLDGCFDVDISATPFTNTLAIQRLGLTPGELAEITVAYIAVPDMQIEPAPQRYTCLENGPKGGMYRYDRVFRQFAATLPVDADRLVMDYPETFIRVWPR